jgi:lipoprotein-releasing system ATP-binding protein
VIQRDATNLGTGNNGQAAPPALSSRPVASSPAPAAATPILRAQNVHRILGSAENPTHILKGVDLTIGGDEYVSIIGASGSGKSTLLYLLGGLDRPNQSDMAGAPLQPPSRVFIDGHDTSTLGDTELAALRNEKVGFVFQFHYLLKEFSAQENVALPMFKLGRLRRGEAMDRAAKLLDQLGLREKARRPANRLSGGEQQRVAIARALANEPAVLLADEPTGNLDADTGGEIVKLLRNLNRDEGVTIVMVTHNMEIVAGTDRVVRMAGGVLTDDTHSFRHPAPRPHLVAV